jgi:exonuclease SbcC
MRPTRLTIKGFGSFREEVDIDFAGIDMFVLFGKTGSGKSSIIDAMTFALYNNIPRLPGNSIKEVVNKGTTRAEVTFEFTVGPQRYRVYRRVNTTTTAPEARLERVIDADNSKPLAEGSRDVSKACERILGLSYSEFTKTIVLPQGAFSDFLHATGSDRQEMLVRLLGLEAFSSVGQLARASVKSRQGRLGEIESRLADLEHATATNLNSWQTRHSNLLGVQASIEQDDLPALDGMKEKGFAAATTLKEAKAKHNALTALYVPDSVAKMSGRIKEADDALNEAKTDADAAADDATAAETAAQDSPDTTPYTDLLAEAAAAQRLVDAAPGLQANADSKRSATNEQSSQMEGLEQRALTNRKTHTDAWRDNLLVDIADGLHAGDDCPVCRRTLDDAPEMPESKVDLNLLSNAAEKADQILADARANLAGLDSAAGIAEQGVLDQQEAISKAQQDLVNAASALDMTSADGSIDTAKVEGLLAAITKTQQYARTLRGTASGLATALRQCESSRKALDVEASDAWGAFGKARDGVAGFGAPDPARTNLADAWNVLVGWADEKKPDAEADVAAAEKALIDARAAYGIEVGKVNEKVAAVNVKVDSQKIETIMSALGGEIATAAGNVTTIADAIATAGELRTEKQEISNKVVVDQMLGDLLRSDKFERWLLTKLSSRLVVGATETLHELSDGAYSITLDTDGSFMVVDHLNGDESRSAKTLSGGETFLVSLALALALADHVASVSTHGNSPLDSLFLDEGFGTLDAATLDVVAGAIESISGGRMVGLITHVKDLADSIPVHMSVEKKLTGSTVTITGVDAYPDQTEEDE